MKLYELEKGDRISLNIFQGQKNNKWVFLGVDGAYAKIVALKVNQDPQLEDSDHIIFFSANADCVKKGNIYE